MEKTKEMTKEELRLVNYPIKLQMRQFVRIKALADEMDEQPYEIVRELLDYGLSKARIGVVTRQGLVFDGDEEVR